MRETSIFFVLLFSFATINSASAEWINPNDKDNSEVTEILYEMAYGSVPASLSVYTDGRPQKIFSIQVASYKSEEEALKKVEELEKNNHFSHYQDVKLKGTTWYRVYLGQFYTKNEAQEFQKELTKNHNFKGAFVTQTLGLERSPAHSQATLKSK